MPATISSQLKHRSYKVLLNGEYIHTLMPKDTITLDLKAPQQVLTFKKSRTQPMIIDDNDHLVLSETQPFKTLNSLPVQISYTIICLLVLPYLLQSNLASTILIPLLLFSPYLPYIFFPQFIN
ncbi:hypothetical protein [Streptococcus fryi]